jgi:hypothetical protein
MGRSITFFLDSWFEQHPFIYWLTQHPIFSLITILILVVLLIRLLVTIYRAIANSIDRLWLWILRSPFLLLKSLFGWEFKSKELKTTNTITNYELTTNSEQLQEIITRLDEVQEQQKLILREIAQLKQQPKNVKSKQIELILPHSESI